MPKEEPATDSNPNPELNTTRVKTKKNKKKKKQAARSESSESSSSLSVKGSIPPLALDESPKEEFYDAHESYHALPENQLAAPATTAALLVAHSEHVDIAKVQDIPAVLTPVPLAATDEGQNAEGELKIPSAISKPVVGPD